MKINNKKDISQEYHILEEINNTVQGRQIIEKTEYRNLPIQSGE